MAKKSLGTLLHEAKVLQDAAKLTKNFGELNDVIISILRNHLDKVTVQLDTKRTHVWEDRYAVLVVVYGNFTLKIPVPELIWQDGELAQKVRNKVKIKEAIDRGLYAWKNQEPLGEELTQQIRNWEYVQDMYLPRMAEARLSHILLSVIRHEVMDLNPEQVKFDKVRLAVLPAELDNELRNLSEPLGRWACIRALIGTRRASSFSQINNWAEVEHYFTLCSMNFPRQEAIGKVVFGLLDQGFYGSNCNIRKKHLFRLLQEWLPVVELRQGGNWTIYDGRLAQLEITSTGYGEDLQGLYETPDAVDSYLLTYLFEDGKSESERKVALYRGPGRYKGLSYLNRQDS